MPSLLLPRFSFSDMSDKKSPPRKEKPFIVRTPQSEDRAMKRKLLSPGSPTLEDDDKKTPIKRKRHSVSLEVSPLSNPKTPVTGSRSVPLSERQQLAMIMRMSDGSSQEALVKPPSPTLIQPVKRAMIDKKVHKRNERGELPIHLAAIKGDVKLLKKLIKAGADVNVADFAGWTPLHEASNRGWLDVAKQLLRAGANVNVQGLENDTPLHDASINGHKKLVELLLKHGANPLQMNSKGKTPLDVAASPDMVRLLKKEIISSGSDSSSLEDTRSPMSPDSIISMKDEDRSLDPEDLSHPRLDSFSSTSSNNRRLSMPKSPTDGKIMSPRLCLKFQRDHLGSPLQKAKDSKEPQYKSYSVTNVSVESGVDNPMFSPVDSPASSVDSDLYNSGLDNLNNFSTGRLKIALSEDEYVQPNWKQSLTVPAVYVENNDSAPMEVYPGQEVTCDLNRNSDCVSNAFPCTAGNDVLRDKVVLKSIETEQFTPRLNWSDSKTEEDSMELPDLEVETNPIIPLSQVTSEAAKVCDPVPTAETETCSSSVNDTSDYVHQRNLSVVTSTSGSNNLVLPGNGVCDKDASQDGSVSSESSVTFSHTAAAGISSVNDSVSDSSCSSTSLTNTTSVHTCSVPAELSVVSSLKWELRSAASPKSDDGSVHSVKSDSVQPCSPARTDKENRESQLSTPKVPPLKIIIPTKSQASSSTDSSERLKLVVTNVKSALPYVINPYLDQGREAEGVPVGEILAADDTFNSENIVHNQSPTSSVLNESQNPSVSTNGPKIGLNRDESDSNYKVELSVNGDRVDRVLDSIDVEGVRSADVEGVRSADGGKVLSEVEESDGDSSRKDDRKAEPPQRVLRSAVRSHHNSADIKPAKLQKSAAEKVDKISNADSPPVSEPQPAAAVTTTTTTSTSRPSSKDEADANYPPRKRKLRTKGDNPQDTTIESTSTSEMNNAEKVPNPYEMYLVLRKKICVRRQGMTVICPKIPQGFRDYLLKTCNYVLQGNTTSTLCVPTLSPPNSVKDKMRDLFVEQEEARYQLRVQHLIERERLILSIEQEILREHGRAARALASQGVPLSACTILRDEEIYNISTDQQDEKDKKNRTRYNGRQFISWIQDVGDKYEKIKELLILRQKQEADSLFAIQKLEWEWRLKELKQCDRNVTPEIDELHVPLVQVHDNFDLLPT